MVDCETLDVKFPMTMVQCQEAAFAFRGISFGGAIKNCVGAVDGYLVAINTPQKWEAKNVKGFFSGHYQKYGINAQACCDAHCCFTYFSLSAPGSRNDRVAILAKDMHGVSLDMLIESLPASFVVIGDAAYKPTEKLVPMYYGVNKREPLYNNFNFFASQCRIRIEMAFGIMTQKWRILLTPLLYKFDMVKLIVLAIARLHNFTFNIRLRQNEWSAPRRCAGLGIPAEEIAARNEAYDGYIEQEHRTRQNEVFGGSFIHLKMAERIQMRGLERPTSSCLHPNHVS
jgi:DDE superfamily endonuclease